MEAVQTLAGQDDMPDSVDVSPAIAQEMVDAGLFEPYVPTVDRRDPARPRRRRQQLDRRLLRHHGDLDQHHDRRERAEDVRRPEEAGVRGSGRAERRSPRGRCRVRRRHGGVDRQRRQRRRHHAGHRVLRRAQGVGQPRRHRRHPGDRAVGRDADRHRLELQRARSGRPARGSRPHGRDQLPDRRRVRRLLRPGCGARTRRTRPARSCGSSTSSPTRVRSATSRVAPCRPATRRWSRPAWSTRRRRSTCRRTS